MADQKRKRIAEQIAAGVPAEEVAAFFRLDDEIDRTAYLTALIGRPWSRERSCWALAREIELDLFGRVLPDITLPERATWNWMMSTIKEHPEREHWIEVPPPPHPGLITARDGALVAMARADSAAHIGVWLAPERRIMHCDERFNVQAEGAAALRAAGWNRLRFYEPVTD